MDALKFQRGRLFNFMTPKPEPIEAEWHRFFAACNSLHQIENRQAHQDDGKPHLSAAVILRMADSIDGVVARNMFPKANEGQRKLVLEAIRLQGAVQEDGALQGQYVASMAALRAAFPDDEISPLQRFFIEEMLAV